MTYDDDLFFSPGYGGIEQISLQEHFSELINERKYDIGIFQSLAFMATNGIGKFYFLVYFIYG